MIAPETVSMRTRDGVRLDADLYRPPGKGPFPVLLMRQPYGRKIASTVVYAHPSWYAAQGYIVIVQDVRGSGTSEGTFKLFEHEREDGADTLAWAATIDGGNGRIGMYGFSYQAATQLLALAGALDSGGPLPQALCPSMMGWDVHSDWAYEGGAFCLAGNMGWALQMGAERARLAGDVAAFTALRAAQRSPPLNDEITALPNVLQRHAQYTHYADWIGHPAPGGYWDRISPKAALAGRMGDVAMLHIGGWHDSMLMGTLDCFHAMAASRAPQRLIVGPWAHLPWAASPVDREQVRWFDRFLKDRDNGIDREPPVRLYDTGRKQWRDFSAWPASAPQAWHIASDGLAAADSEAGRLQREPIAVDDVLVHDPWRPAPSIANGQDRRAVDDRSDVACYTSAPLDRPLSLTGAVRAEIEIAADQPTHDLAAILSQVMQDGRAIVLTQGYLRIADAASPGPRVVAMRALCATLPAGARLRLSLQAASFPAMAMNAGSGATDAEARPFDSRIITLSISSGRLLLPVEE
ncbi:MAG TPA: CocE/NonD family hydrolase, partial [Reyranella sp.]|nr:CocE/NonD family hydrolase [Reyranella sp.]